MNLIQLRIQKRRIQPKNIPTYSKIDGLKLVLKSIRLIYIGGAICFLCFGYYTTILLGKEGHLNTKEEVKDLQKYRYPSITFCYVFKNSVKTTVQNSSTQHNSAKFVWNLYYHHLYQKWKQSGNYHSICFFG